MPAGIVWKLPEADDDDDESGAQNNQRALHLAWAACRWRQQGERWKIKKSAR